MLVTPLVTDQSSQVDVVKSAQALGIPTALCVASWDHLTTKGLIRARPDLVFVWNERQRAEALEYHGVAPDRLVVTGAQPFDRWFERRPSSREAFCRKVGLRSDRPFVLFVGSTFSISAPDAELRFVLRWVDALRRDPALAEVGILIRPHPYNSAHWSDVDFPGRSNVAVYPRSANPVNEADRQDYFDSLFHSETVVGINTTAMIEAAIVGRTVHSVLADEFKDTQGGTLHFRYLLSEHGGFLRVATGLRRARAAGRRDAAVARYRPRGVCPLRARVRSSARSRRGGHADPGGRIRAPGGVRSPGGRPHATRALSAAVAALDRGRSGRIRAAHEDRRDGAKTAQRRAQEAEEAEQAQAAHQEARAHPAGRGAHRAPGAQGGMMASGLDEGARARRSAVRRALSHELETLRGTPAYRNYEYVRDRVLEMRIQADVPEWRPSAYWREELSNFEYMFDASPLIIDKLRHHTYHVTGLRVYDYRTHRDHARRQFAEKLQALAVQASPGLLVPEWRELGGFGFDIDGQLCNLDTLKFFEVLIALEKAAVLQEFRQATDRRLVWEIGAGWGGFAYQFKRLCPNVTYVIMDLPELFLFSATYLMTAFPEAKVGFWGEAPTDHLFAVWRDCDFIFIPHTALDELKLERLDLTINMVSFQEMSDDQVAGYVARAHALGSTFLYSLNREKGPYNRHLESVSAIVSRFYWPRTIEVLPVPYTRMLDGTPAKNDYKHLVGWRRVKI